MAIFKKQTCGLFSIVAFAYMASRFLPGYGAGLHCNGDIIYGSPVLLCWMKLCKAELCPRLAPCLKGEPRAL